MDFLKKFWEISYPSVLGHLDCADHVEALLRESKLIIEVLRDEPHFVTMMFVQTTCIVNQVMSRYNASDFCALLRKIFNKPAPARADVKCLHAWLHAQRVD